MSQMPVAATTEDVDRVLQAERALPQDPTAERIVLWRIFRAREEAMTFSRAVLLGEGQQLVGGVSADSVGPVFWLGVQVDDLARWGNSKAIQMTDGFDAEVPGVQGRPFED